ncbi:MAG: enolase C-terminal domain-like protein [Candidatus Zixiibacteriota bacterium]
MEINVARVALPLKKRFAVAKGSAEVKTNVLTILNNRYSGEASGSVYYGPPVELIEVDIRKGIEFIKWLPRIDVSTLNSITCLDILPIARSALMGMVLNAISGESGRYPWEILGLGTPVGIRSSLTIGIDTHEVMKKAILESPHAIIKLKLGHEQDCELLDVIKAVTDKEIRVDANGGWTCAKAEEMIYYLGKAGVTIVEQPTEPEYSSEWPHLKKASPSVELIIDEGLNRLEDYDQFKDSIDGVNIKMEKCGGILEGIRIARQARTDKKKVMLGCMVESSIGIAQSVYMSSLADYCDLDGPLLLENDIASGIVYQREYIKVDREIIGGPKLKRDLFDKYVQT